MNVHSSAEKISLYDFYCCMPSWLHWITFISKNVKLFYSYATQKTTNVNFLKSIKKVLITCKFIQSDNGRGPTTSITSASGSRESAGILHAWVDMISQILVTVFKDIISSSDVIGNHHTNYILYQIDMLMKCKTRCRKTFPLNIYFSYGKVYHSMGMLILIFNYKHFSMRLIHS